MFFLVSFTGIGDFYKLQDTILLFMPYNFHIWLVMFGTEMAAQSCLVILAVDISALVMSSSHSCLCMQHVANNAISIYNLSLDDLIPMGLY